MTQVGITEREYNAIVYAYARLIYELEHNMFPDEIAARSAQGAVNILDKFTDKVKNIIETTD